MTRREDTRREDTRREDTRREDTRREDTRREDRPRVPLPSRGGYLMSKAQQISGRIFNRLLKEAGGGDINSAQGRILFALWTKGGMSISTLAKETALEPSTLTSMLDRLEAAGFARRCPSPEDRRAFVVECTDEGRGLEAEYSAVSERMTALFYGSMGEREIAAFEAALGKIVGNLEEAERELK
jgi:MarR family transcriptional regulator, organic hydroperoxide resistance regulator